MIVLVHYHSWIDLANLVPSTRTVVLMDDDPQRILLHFPNCLLPKILFELVTVLVMMIATCWSPLPWCNAFVIKLQFDYYLLSILV